MSDDSRNHAADLRGASRLLVDGTRGVTDVVRDMHVNIASGPEILGRPLAGPARLITQIVYGVVGGVTEAVGMTIEAALEQLSPLLGGSKPGPARDAVVAAVNGVVGDHLVATHNPLALPMRAYSSDDAPTGHLLVMVHGSCMSYRQWLRNGHDHGAVLAEALGASRVDVSYNSGLHISTNGAQLAELLEDVVARWPVSVEHITIVGFSMGGLVARSAVHAAEESPSSWRAILRALAFVGTPHHGAPLERGGNWIDSLLGVSSYSAPIGRLGRMRSAGITDLRYGNTLDEHWRDRDRFEKTGDPRTPLPLPTDVDCFAVAGTLGPGNIDGLVPVSSALGVSETPELQLAFAEDHTMLVEAGHLDLLAHTGVGAQLCDWLA